MIRNLFRFRSLACAAALGLCVGSPMRADEKADLAQGARKVLATYCYKCHGEAGRAEGVSFNFAIDLKKLVDTKRVAPGSPRNSKLFKRLTSEDDPMPPEFDDADTSASRKPLPRPGKDDVDVVRRWIEAGAPNGATAPAPKPRPFLAESEILQAIGEDLSKIDARYRGSARYFTITHLYNAGLSPDELLTYRNGLSKLVNSLSWGRRIVVPRPIDPAETIYRIDLRDFKWDEKVWQAILAHYPYGVTLDTDYAKGIYAATHCELPYVRADWFVFAASKPPLYHKDGPSRDKVDYRERLSPEDFTIFARLRDLRKQVAQSEAVPVYAIFTNEQLARMVQIRAASKTALETIPGVGDGRIEKYGPKFLDLLKMQWDGADAQGRPAL